MQQYVLDVNAHRSSQETVDILSSLLTTALQPDPDYRLTVPTLLVHGDLDRGLDLRFPRPWPDGRRDADRGTRSFR